MGIVLREMIWGGEGVFLVVWWLLRSKLEVTALEEEESRLFLILLYDVIRVSSS